MSIKYENYEALGYRIGKSSPENWEAICDAKKQAIEVEQNGIIEGLKRKGSLLAQKEREILAYFQEIGGYKPEVVLNNRIHAFILLTVCVALMLSSAIFTYFAFEPFPLSIFKKVVISAGLVASTVYLGDAFLHSILVKPKKYIIAALTGTGIVFLLFGNVVLSILRSHILKFSILSGQETNQGIWSILLSKLLILLPVVCTALELAAIVCFFYCKTYFSDPERKSRNKLDKVRMEMTNILSNIRERSSYSNIFEAQFKVGAYRAISEIQKKNEEDQKNSVKDDNPKQPMEPEKKTAIAIIVIFLLIFFFAIFVSNLNATEIIINVDLTGSAKGSTYKSSSEFTKNLNAVKKVLANVSSGSNITILGISDDSFSKSFIILRQKIGKDPGYFKEKIKVSRKKLIEKWKEKSKELKPIFPKTDILGAMSLSSVLFRQSTDKKKVLLIFSDMRNSTRKLNLEIMQRLDSSSLLNKVKRLRSIPSLKGVEVYILGVSTSNKSFRYWKELKRFWESYFRSSGAVLKTYSINREVDYE